MRLIYLVDSRHHLGRLECCLDVLRHIVRDTNGLCKPLCLNLLHLRPSFLQLLIGLGEERRMNQIQVHVVKLQLFQAGLDGVGDVGDVVHDLCCDVELASVDAAFLDCRAQFIFRLVYLGAVEMVVWIFLARDPQAKLGSTYTRA